MTTEIRTKKKTVPWLLAQHRKGERLTMLTAYDATFARMADQAGIDMLLVGDSLGMVVQGHDNTLPVTLDEIIYHTRCVSRGARNALVIADLPFMSYQASTTQAMLAAGRAMKEGGAAAVKLEGGLELAERVAALTDAGIPVVAHIGLRPQSVHRMGGYRIQGRTADDAALLVEEARAFENAGAFALVIEGVAVESAREITDAVTIPTIGIAAGPHCSGQVLVCYDLLGLNPDFNPTFLKKYADGHTAVTKAIGAYIDEVRSGAFPTEGHGFRRKNP